MPTVRMRRWAPKVKSGCITCKIRKIKCDEEKPSCRRCTSTGRTCDGYGPRAPLLEFWHDHFMPFVLDELKLYFTLADDAFSSVPRLLSKAREGSSLYSACNAVGRAYMMGKTRSAKAVSEGARAYGNALSTLRSAIGDRQECRSDNTLLAIWFLSMFEVFLGASDPSARADGTPGWKSHNQVLTHLVSLRGSEIFASLNGRRLFTIIFSNVLAHALVPSHDFSDCPTWFIKFHQHCQPSEYPMLRAHIYTYQCARIISRILRLIDVGDVDEILSCSWSILQEMNQIEKATYPFSNGEPVTKYEVEPLTAPYTCPDHMYPGYIGIQITHTVFRMRLSHHAIWLLDYASRAPSCTLQQRVMLGRFRDRCIEELRLGANKVSHLMATTPKRKKLDTPRTATICLDFHQLVSAMRQGNNQIILF